MRGLQAVEKIGMDPLIEKQSILSESGKNAQSFHKKTPKWPKSGDSVPLSCVEYYYRSYTVATKNMVSLDINVLN